MTIRTSPATVIDSEARTPLSSCLACGGVCEGIYRVDGVPIHSCRLVGTRAEAEAFPTGDIRLSVCRSCGFVQNDAFEPSRLDYSIDYEETQGFSPTFSTFAEQLACRLVDDYNVRGSRVLEVGCGKGEFLQLLCEFGANDGLGIDPSFQPGRLPPHTSGRTTFIRDLYGPKYAALTAAFVCCRHTLEHIAEVGPFMDLLARSTEPGGVVSIEVPDAGRVLADAAFWDIYYEHCSYFSPDSLSRLMRRTGLVMADVRLEYDDQYIIADGRRPRPGAPAVQPILEELAASTTDVVGAARRFATYAPARLALTRTRLDTLATRGAKVVLWGAGSKAVSFLTTLRVGEQVLCAVDINPNKHGKFLPGTGHQVAAPADLREIRPDVVVVMNPMYLREVAAELTRLGLEPAVVPVDDVR